MAPGEAIYFPDAFDGYGRRVLETHVPKLLAVNEEEAQRFACNAVVLGQEVVTLVDRQEMDDGDQEVELNAANLPSGVYFYQLRAEAVPDEDEGFVAKTYTAVRKMLLVK